MSDQPAEGVPFDLCKALGITDLEDALKRLTNGDHRVGVNQRDIDAIHEGLLRKKRQTGDLRLS